MTPPPSVASFPSFQISGLIPSALGSLAALSSLSLTQNAFQARAEVGRGAGLPWVGRFACCRPIRMCARPHHHPSPPLSTSERPSLSLLHIGARLFSPWISGPLVFPAIAQGFVPSELAFAKKLKYLDLSWNSLSGTLPPQLYSLNTLATLDVGFNSIRWIGNKHIKGGIDGEGRRVHPLRKCWPPSHCLSFPLLPPRPLC